jgi:hypothetical protein
MSITDREVVAAIGREAELLGLSTDTHRHGARFCTVYMEAPGGPWEEQFRLLSRAKLMLEVAGVPSVKLTRFDNPPYRSQATGKMEPGHPRHGAPLLEIQSVWWVQP